MNDGSHYWITYKPHIGPGMGVRAYIRWLGQIDTWGNSIYLQRCEDGCILIRVAKGYLYPGEYHAVLEALTKLVKDYDTMRAIQSARYRAVADLSKEHCGPKEDTCQTCGLRIGDYESRWYGPAGAVHAGCLRKGEAGVYPLYYTDG